MESTMYQKDQSHNEETDNSVSQLELPQNTDDHIHTSEMAILSIPDFDGNGEVNSADVEDITLRINTSEGDELYHPLYDVDANGAIDEDDLAIVDETIGHEVPLIDQQIAQATQATMKYYGMDGQERAIADGYIPVTQEFQGHGIHYFNIPLALEIGESPELDPTTPVGLNYDAEGNLSAVFYIRVPETLEATPENPIAFLMVDPADDFPPVSFDGISAEDWHTHENFWSTSLGSLNSEEVYGFEEYVPIDATISRLENIGFQQFPESDQIFSPKFWMLHGWFHSLNPSGTFANLDPNLSLYAPEELGAHGEHEGESHDHEGHSEEHQSEHSEEHHQSEYEGESHDHEGHSEGHHQSEHEGESHDHEGHSEGHHQSEHEGESHDHEGHSEGSDELIAGTDLEDGLQGTDQSDRLNGFNGDDWIYGGLGDDSVWGGRGHDWLIGDDPNCAEGGDDMLYGGPGRDVIYGHVGDDRLFGGTEDDLIVGGEGDDILRGSLGYDDLTGGEGADKFVLVRGEVTDTIHDFEIDSDTIVLYGGLTLEDVSITQSSGDTMLDANDETLAVLRGINAEELIMASSDVFLVV